VTAIELQGVSKSFGSTQVLRDLDLAIDEGSITAVLGESGSGKTTLLRLIAGFDQVGAGSISIGGRLMDDGRRSVQAQHRGVGYVPQDGALFPHLSVLENVAFGLSRARRSEAEALIELVGLAGLERRYPNELSGGEQQRVALARALAIRPTVVLLDEPFSSLDASLRVGLGLDVVRILKETGTTALLVTHDQDEALALADQIAVLRAGRVAAIDDPQGLYRDPPDVAAAMDIGDVNILAADTQAGLATSALGTVGLRVSPDNNPSGPSRLLLRPEQLVLHATPVERTTRATVVNVQYHGHDALVSVSLDPPGSERLLARVSGQQALAPGQVVWVEVTGQGRAWPVEAGSVPAQGV
jgi:iron(III) transport system ATP-binding protein